MAEPNPNNPLIVQGDRTVLVEVQSPRYVEARDALVPFAELVKSPEYVHTYRITALSIWNACAIGLDVSTILETLRGLAKYDLPRTVEVDIREFASRYGRLRLEREKDQELTLQADDAPLKAELSRHRELKEFFANPNNDNSFSIPAALRGRLKQALIKAGWPVADLAGYSAGETLDIRLRGETRQGKPFAPRDYQQSAAESFHASGTAAGGAGVIVLPCGAGKTIVGLACMAQVQTSTLILTTNVTATRQWVAEILDKTHLDDDQVGEYNGETKEIRPVTVATYHIITWRSSKDGSHPHLEIFDRRNWGLIIYDEVHLLPAPIFQITAGLQARRRLGLTATLVREDGREDEVFALIGPKKVDVPWKVLEQQGWIAEAQCHEIRIPLPDVTRMNYAVADSRAKFRIASENPAKSNVVRDILHRHPDESVLIISMYVEQLQDLAAQFQIPIITGSTSQKRRDELFGDFRSGKIRILAVSKVANFAIDLPDASVAIQVSGTFGSRQEEAQRLGRILRPKPGKNQATFYTVISRDTVEQEFAMNRQMFLIEQGYEYQIHDHELDGQRSKAS